jgi:hypothetical protein
MTLGMPLGLGAALRNSMGSSTSLRWGTASCMMVAAVVMSVMFLGSVTGGPLILNQDCRQAGRVSGGKDRGS